MLMYFQAANLIHELFNKDFLLIDFVDWIFIKLSLILRIQDYKFML